MGSTLIRGFCKKSKMILGNFRQFLAARARARRVLASRVLVLAPIFRIFCEHEPRARARGEHAPRARNKSQ